jgi:hypothetical protein
MSYGFQQHPDCTGFSYTLWLWTLDSDGWLESICWFFIEGKFFFRLRRMSTPETNDLKQ